MSALTLTAILPNFNHARFLPAALESVIAQQRKPDELLIVDDASTDDSVAIIESYLPRLPNARFERNRSNVGALRTINRMLADATGSIVCTINADDIIYPDFFATGMAMLEQYPAAALFSGRIHLLDEAGNVIGVMETPVPRWWPGFIGPAEAAAFLMRDEGWFAGQATLFRRAPLAAAGGFPEALHSFNDGYISRLLALQHGACFTPAVLAGWRRMRGGMAWLQTADLHNAQNLTAVVVKTMQAAGDIFPAGYPERWRQRYMFGVRRFILSEARREAAKRGRGRYLVALLREWLWVLILFARMRPRDAFTVARRRIGYRLRRHD
ncbi:MAG: glycosyltransferase family 2 protein [Alphaproteobacteria bacterium]|nr:glycosyltransferase family 2 protein [Alphaproteobacteria bacterium]